MLESKKSTVQSLNFARFAEIERARLYVATLLRIEQPKRGARRAFYVCPICGYSTCDDNLAKCPSCLTAKDRFEKFAQP
jgi:rubrerythrin